MRTYRVWDAFGDREDGRDVRAQNAKDAAEQYCAQRDNERLEFPPSSLVKVQSWTGEITRFDVTCATVPMYGAKMLRTETLRIHKPEGAA